MVRKGKVIPVTCHGGLEGCDESRLPYFPDSRLTDGGDGESPASLYLQENTLHSFLLEAK
jgi:hypothetical protein